MSDTNQTPSIRSSRGQDAKQWDAELRLRLLEAQTLDAEIKLEKARREELRAEAEADLKLKQLKAQVDRAELELKGLRRETEKADAEAEEAMTYTFYDGVTADTVKDAIAEISAWTRRFPKHPLKLVLNSPGGSVIAGLAFYDFLRFLSASGHEITVVSLGMAASMGGVLLQAGDKRIMGRESMLLIHEVSSGTHGKVSEMEDDLKFSQELWDKLANILANRAKATGKKTLTAKQIKNRALKYDWWLSAEEALNLGFADEIL